MFISTVRTVHTCREVKRKQKSLSPESRLYFEFLTDPKLLNTAFTRAESLVAVVGDPYSLCTVGECQRLWEELIERCSAKGKLFGITTEELEEKMTRSGLNVNVPEFVPGGTSRSGDEKDSHKTGCVNLQEDETESQEGKHSDPPAVPLVKPELGLSTAFTEMTSDSNATLCTVRSESADEIHNMVTPSSAQPVHSKVSSKTDEEPLSKHTTTEAVEGSLDGHICSSTSESDSEDDSASVYTDDEKADDPQDEDEDDDNICPIEMDDIIRAFQEACIEKRREDKEKIEAKKKVHPGAKRQQRGECDEEGEEHGHDEQGRGYSSEELGLANHNNTVDDIEMVHINGRTVIRLVNLRYTRDHTPRTKRLLCPDDSPPKESLDPEFLKRLLEEDPQKYIKCRLHINAERYRQAYGEVQDTESKDVFIKGQPRQAFEQDAVVIELIESDKRPDGSEKKQGSQLLAITEDARPESMKRASTGAISGACSVVPGLRSTGCTQEQEKKTGKVVGELIFTHFLLVQIYHEQDHNKSNSQT